MKSAYDIVKAPLISERLSRMAEKGNVVAFKVDRNANKIEIKRAIETLWNVKVEDVRTQRYQGKMKRLGRFQGRRPEWKKAIVRLAEGQAIPDLT